MIKCVIFDLDGTLVNTIDDLANTCEYLLKQNGITSKWTMDDYKSFVGNGAKVLVERAFDGKLTESELNEQYEIFKVKYNEDKLKNAYAYDGMTEVVNALKANGFKLACCSNKPHVSTTEMVEALYGKGTFDFILGGKDDVPKKPSREMTGAILKALNVKASECVWVGDSGVDIQSARNLGCECIAVTWGFRSFGELFKFSPTVILDRPEEILSFLNVNS